jgi:hypothetical protein
MTATRQMVRVDSDRWIYRTSAGDFGPVTTDGMLEAIRSRKVSLETPISALGTQQWASLGNFAIFRDHFEKCRDQWEREENKRAAEEIGRRIELRQKTSAGAGVLIGLGSIAGLGVLAWVVWRLSLASPTGLETILRLETVSALPVVTKATTVAAAVPVPVEQKVARLGEPESYDTSGVAIGLDGGAVTQKMHFDESGEVQSIPQETLDRIVSSARQGLYGCAKEAALRNPAFGGTEVGFTIAPGVITKVGVGGEARGNPAFLACVKATLARVSVPSFQGNERRVTVPLKIER